MLIIGIILIIISILLVIYSIHSLKNVHQINQDIDKQNQELQREHNKLIKNLDVIKKEFFNENQNYRDIKQEVLVANKELIETRRHLNDIQNDILKTTETQKELSQKAFENYCEVLEKQYKEYEKEYDMYKDALKTSYSNLQLKLMREADETKTELDKIKATRTAALQAQLKEQEIKEKLSFYCLTIKQTDLDDIKILERMKNQLHNPRILSMLIWSTYFQKPMTALCNNIIGTEIKSGIYKITNQNNNMCYIGQSNDLARRWKDHAKCGLGIDAPQNNKLYQAMIQDGLWNFSFEILEECPQSQLNEKERYYIQLYQSYEFGYNSSKGINK